MLLPLRPNELLRSPDGRINRKIARRTIRCSGFEQWGRMASLLGYTLELIHETRSFTLADFAKRVYEGPEEVRTDVKKLKIIEPEAPRFKRFRAVLMLFRALQAFRLVDLDCGFQIRSQDIVVNVNEFVAAKLPARGSEPYRLYGIKALWSLFLRRGLPRNIIIALTKTTPGRDPAVSTFGLDLNIYDMLLLEELAYTTRNWNYEAYNTLGEPLRGKRKVKLAVNTLYELRPVNDASALITLACVSGLVIPRFGPQTEYVLEEVTPEMVAKFKKEMEAYYRNLGRWLGNFIPFGEAVKAVDERRVPANIASWQLEAIESAMA